MSAAETIKARNERIRAILATVARPKINVDAAVKAAVARNARIRALVR